MMRVFAALAVLVGAAALLIAEAARSDFAMRGCREIARSDWDLTANCADGWLAQVVFGGSGLLCCVGAVLLWRRGRPA